MPQRGLQQAPRLGYGSASMRAPQQAPRLSHSSANMRMRMHSPVNMRGSAGMRRPMSMRGPVNMRGSASMRSMGGMGGYGGMGDIRSMGMRGGFGGSAYDSDGLRRSAQDKDRSTFGHENGRFGGIEHGERNSHGGDDRRRSMMAMRGYGGDYDSDGPMRSQHDRDFVDIRHENGPYGRVDHGEKDAHDGDRDDPDKGYEGYGVQPGYFGDSYDSDGPERSAHDKDMYTYGHENGMLDMTEFGERNNQRGDDRPRGYGMSQGMGGYGAGMGQGGRMSLGRGGYGGMSRGAPAGFGRGGHSGMRQSMGLGRGGMRLRGGRQEFDLDLGQMGGRSNGYGDRPSAPVKPRMPNRVYQPRRQELDMGGARMMGRQGGFGARGGQRGLGGMQGGLQGGRGFRGFQGGRQSGRVRGFGGNGGFRGFGRTGGAAPSGFGGAGMMSRYSGMRRIFHDPNRGFGRRSFGGQMPRRYRYAG